MSAFSSCFSEVFLHGLQQYSEHEEMLPLSFAASPSSVFYSFLFLLLLISKCLEVIRNAFSASIHSLSL